MHPQHVTRLGVYFVDFDIFVMDDYGNLMEVDFRATLFNFSETP